MRVLSFYLSSNISSFPFLFFLGEGLNGIVYSRAIKTNPTDLTAQQSDGHRPGGLLVYI